MQLEYAPQGLVGLLTPQANTTVEPEAWALLPTGFSLVNARMVSDAPELGQRLLDYVWQIERSLVQFANAPLSVLSLACTGSSYLMGQEAESQWVAQWEGKSGLPVVTAGLAVVDALRALNAQRIDLVSPYPADLTQASVAYWKSHGFDVGEVREVSTPQQGFHSIYLTSMQSASEATQSLSDSTADAVLMLGTGMPTLKTLLAQRGRPGPPVLSSMLALMWRSVSRAQAANVADDPLQNIHAWLAGSHWALRAQTMGIEP